MTGSTHRKAPPSQEDRRSVSLTPRDIEDAARLLAKIAGVTSESRAASPAERESNVRGEPERLRRCARRLYEQRQRRIAHFGSQMFGEPAWEMLLILYLAEGGERQSQARLVDLSGASRSTGGRWIDHLVRKGLARREGHPTDKRCKFVSLSEKGRELLELYLFETCE